MVSPTDVPRAKKQPVRRTQAEKKCPVRYAPQAEKTAPAGIPEPKNRSVRCAPGPDGLVVRCTLRPKKRPRQHTLPQAGLSTGAPPNRKTSPGRCTPGLNGLTDRPGPNNLADRYAPRTEKLLRPAASLGCPSLGCPRGVCSSSDASPGGRSAAARYRVVPGSRW